MLKIEIQVREPQELNHREHEALLWIENTESLYFTMKGRADWLYNHRDFESFEEAAGFILGKTTLANDLAQMVIEELNRKEALTIPAPAEALQAAAAAIVRYLQDKDFPRPEE